jgi:hypothetical protein
MFCLLATPRDGGSSAGPAGLSSMLVLLAALLLATPAMAYGVPDAVEDIVASPAAQAIAAPMRLAQAQPTPAPPPAPARPAAPAPASPPASANSPAASPSASPADEPIGNVATLTGSATVTRNNQSAVPLNLKDDIYLNDVLQTAANSTLGVTFSDETTFNLTANATITVDNYIYEDGGKQNSALFDITKGTVAFVAAAVAKTGDMKISTPSATLGIRGTTGLVEVDGTTAGAHNIKLYPDPDGRVGHIDVSDRNGVRLGALTQASSGFTVRTGAAGRVTATPLTISPQQAARDQGIVRQVHAAQVVGRQVVTEQRALRQNRTPGQPGQQRQNNLQQNRPGPNQKGAPNRSGQQGQPPNRTGQPGQPSGPKQGQQPGQQQNQPQPATPNRAGQQGQQPSGGQPGQQHTPAAEQHHAPGAHQPGLQNRPSPQPKRPPAAPKGKKEKRR